MEQTRSRRRRRPTRAAPPPVPAPEALPAEGDGHVPELAGLVPVDPLPTDDAGGEHEPGAPLATPELDFARRVPLPAPEVPLPTQRRAIFFDVENTSQAGRIARIIEHLGLDRRGWRTEFVAVGNWRVIGQDTARLLARHGAQLVHSAPSAGVKDWSDLRIAVSAGAWLAAARPGDVIEIVSDDRAFDAVGDVAAGLGITFHRLTSRSLAGEPEPRAPEPARSGESRGGRGRGGRGRGRGGGGRGRAPAAEPRTSAAPSVADLGEGHTAPHDELVEVVRELAARAPNGQVLIDTLERTLKARGFSRPPGSPRLITRLRRIKELVVSPRGMITLADAPHVAPRDEPLEIQPVLGGEVGEVGEVGEADDVGNVRESSATSEAAATAAAPARRRRSRRGGRRHRRKPSQSQP